MLLLVTDGLNLCPPNPNYIQARDAILQADLVEASNPLNNCPASWGLLWQAFVKRGMGAYATAPDSSTTVGVVESFAVQGQGSPCNE